MGKNKQKKLKQPFDKYYYYTKSVQSPEVDVLFLRDTYKELRRKFPRILREDFCGTFANSCEWVKLHREFVAHGVDLDPEPVAYGREHYLGQLADAQKKRVHIHLDNVLKKGLPRADVIAALNFSYFIFKERKVLKEYLAGCLKSLKPKGLMVMDCFGGSQCYEALEEEMAHKGFSYIWDLESYDPVTNHALYHIHFKLKKEKKRREKCFTYDWRMWSIPELRELLMEVGFKKTHVYWEGTTKKGEGDGNFTRTETGEECGGWIAYIVSEK